MLVTNVQRRTFHIAQSEEEKKFLKEGKLATRAIICRDKGLKI